MTWLLVTTRHTNPGDEFARMGVQVAVRSADPQADFVLVNKESPEIHRPVPFDRAIYCGQPLFWTFPWSESWSSRTIDWWKPLMAGWISEDPTKFAAIGVGDVMTHDWTPARPQEFEDIVRGVEARCAFLTLRAPIGVSGPRVSCCPSAFAFIGPHKPALDLKLCNFMPNGGHFYHPREEWEGWKRKEQGLSDRLRLAGFTFIAHVLSEVERARSLGWKPGEILFPGDADEAAKLYRFTRCFFGNRVHGAAVTAAQGKPAWCVTYDSRLLMAERLGARTCKPSRITGDELDRWIANPAPSRPQVDVRAEFDWTVNRLKEMMK